jgi:hypothetical protein
MSRIKNMPGVAWLVIGVLVTLLVIPSTAYAAALKFTGIEGTSTNKADVTPAGQLLTAEANPSSFYQPEFVYLDPGAYLVPIAVPPSSSALVITTIHIDPYYNPTPGSTAEVGFEVLTSTGCDAPNVGSYEQAVYPGSTGEIDIPLAPGLAIPAGATLCAFATGDLDTAVSVSGYAVPSGAVPAEAAHAAPFPKQP